MTLALTPEMLDRAYEYLRVTSPFRGWKLPHADDIQLRVTRSMDWYGRFMSFRRVGNAKRYYRIEISAAKHGHSLTFIHTLAHEMVHLRQALARTESRQEHNPEFYRLARRVAKHHGFDPKGF